MEEASRYTVSLSWVFFSLGKQDFSSSSFFSRRDGMLVATDEGCDRGCSSEIGRGANLGPLRMIMEDGREAEVPGSSGLVNATIEERTEDVLERNTQESMEEGNEVGEPC